MTVFLWRLRKIGIFLHRHDTSFYLKLLQWTSLKAEYQLDPLTEYEGHDEIQTMLIAPWTDAKPTKNNFQNALSTRSYEDPIQPFSISDYRMIVLVYIPDKFMGAQGIQL